MVKYNFSVWTWTIYLLTTGVSSAGSSQRTKRVVRGEIIVGRTAGYDVIRYFGAIGFQHGAGLWFNIRNFFRRSTRARLTCSGSLITPLIVQTACHCVSDFDYRRPVPIRGAVLDFHWENVKVVYIGVNDEYGQPWSMETVKPLQTRRFFIHSKCGEFKSGAITHDYGWIKVDDSWISALPGRATGLTGVPVAGVNFAPVYTERHLAEIWEYTLKTKAVCLHIGFGRVIIHQKALSPMLRHGWAVLMSYDECFNEGYITIDPVADYLTYVCSEPFAKHDQPGGGGDSGSPVTCNNFHFGLASHAFYNEPVKKYQNAKLNVGLEGAIVFSPFAHARDYRKEFINFINNNGQSTNNEHDNLRTRTFKPAQRCPHNLSLIMQSTLVTTATCSILSKIAS